jgi:dCTP deaminase
MTVLPDHEIGKLCRPGVKSPLIFPYDADQQQPASYDLALGHDFIVFDNYEQTHLDLGDLHDKSPRKLIVTPEQGFTLHPLKFALGVTQEVVWLPDDIAGELMGKSSLARTGLLIHVTGGFVDPGFHGPLTLEFFNAREIPIILRPELPIAQIGFRRLETPASQPYQGRYQDAKTVEPSKYTG